MNKINEADNEQKVMEIVCKCKHVMNQKLIYKIFYQKRMVESRIEFQSSHLRYTSFIYCGIICIYSNDSIKINRKMN